MTFAWSVVPLSPKIILKLNHANYDGFSNVFLFFPKMFSGIWSGAHGYSDRGSGSDVATTAYKGRGALPTETVVPKPQSSAKDHWWPIATHGWRRQVLVRLEVLHHDHSDNPDSHTSARDSTLGPIQIRPSACTVILKLIYSFRTLLNQPGSEMKLR